VLPEKIAAAKGVSYAGYLLPILFRGAGTKKIHCSRAKNFPMKQAGKKSPMRTLRESNPERGCPPPSVIDQLCNSYCDELAF
jgi:hypothetical protein